jgi:predicted RNA binding protein YcfA (HicA-like mRNA interferase family)
MSEIPRVTGKEAVRAFERAGFALVRISSSHHIMKKAGCRNILSIPVHSGKTVGKGLLKSQIDAAEMTVEQFIAHLK